MTYWDDYGILSAVAKDLWYWLPWNIEVLIDRLLQYLEKIGSDAHACFIVPNQGMVQMPSFWFDLRVIEIKRGYPEFQFRTCSSPLAPESKSCLALQFGGF
ncbi:predicted protein [Scheffersomyces stipitis CBS 6054]|uniref:Uncharacterized protein n=1 Tax=Scheffersomyces stipitis (strain ATCC 58785 / CBS 6054 / NBRC 10063 / NRRL Y-11545) TaxID=322104 RepID=A3LXU3_PICST|nr:predicted protein [Scheffersomyces stipitis CBS 6054]ABN67861.2 predicted protein [Scheffersomyces stipitis CBS 6054]